MDLITLLERVQESSIMYKNDMEWRSWFDRSFRIPKNSARKVFLGVRSWLASAIMLGAEKMPLRPTY